MIFRLLHDDRCPVTTNPSGNTACDCAVSVVIRLQAEVADLKQRILDADAYNGKLEALEFANARLVREHRE